MRLAEEEPQVPCDSTPACRALRHQPGPTITLTHRQLHPLPCCPLRSPAEPRRWRRARPWQRRAAALPACAGCCAGAASRPGRVEVPSAPPLTAAERRQLTRVRSGARQTKSRDARAAVPDYCQVCSRCDLGGRDLLLLHTSGSARRCTRERLCLAPTPGRGCRCRGCSGGASAVLRRWRCGERRGVERARRATRVGTAARRRTGLGSRAPRSRGNRLVARAGRGDEDKARVGRGNKESLTPGSAPALTAARSETSEHIRRSCVKLNLDQFSR